MLPTAPSSALNLLLFLLAPLILAQAAKVGRSGNYNEHPTSYIPKLVDRMENLMREGVEDERRKRRSNLYDHLVLYYPSWFVKQHISRMSSEQTVLAYDSYGEQESVGFMLDVILDTKLGWRKGHVKNCEKLLDHLAAYLEVPAYPSWYCLLVRSLGSSGGNSCEGVIRKWLNNEKVGHRICPASRSLSLKGSSTSLETRDPDLVELIKQLFRHLVLSNENEARLAILMAMTAHDGRLEYQRVSDVSLDVPGSRDRYNPFLLVEYNIACCIYMRKELLSSSLDQFTRIPLSANQLQALKSYLAATFSLADLHKIRRSSSAKDWLTIFFTQSGLDLPLPRTVVPPYQPVSRVPSDSGKQKDSLGQHSPVSPLKLLDNPSWCMKQLHTALIHFLRSSRGTSSSIKAVLKLDISPSSLYRYMLTWIDANGGSLDVSTSYHDFCTLILSQECL